MMRLASKPPCGPATSSSEPTLPALAASEPAPEESAPLAPTSVDCEAPALGFLLAHPVLVKAAASIRTISIFRIPYSTLLPLVRQRRLSHCRKVAGGAQPAS